MSLAFFDFGFSEMLLVGVVALLVFGGNLPDVMRTLGRNYAKFRQSLRQFSQPVREEFTRIRDIPPPTEGTIGQDRDDPSYDDLEGESPESVSPDDVPGDGVDAATTPLDTPQADERPTTPPDDAVDEPPPV